MALITITDYDPAMQPRIDEMMSRIQKEFPEPITSVHSTVMKDVYLQADQKFWVAHDENGRMAGTVGVKLGEGYAEIKRMFVDPEFRGPLFPTAKELLKTATVYAEQKGLQKIYLGTMAQFIAAQKFYEKSGFRKIKITQLPPGYKINPMDTIFYYRD